jgi:formamidopyrimidine-DNA glycosylase
MPELPEVETTCRGISSHIIGAKIYEVVLRNHRLRWPVPKSIIKELKGLTVRSVNRRGKYILIQFETGWLIIHLGMSGSLRLVDKASTPEKHDHFDLIFESANTLRFKDPRRFGSIHWTSDEPGKHKLLQDLGPEPLSNEFSGNYLYVKSRNKTQAIKSFIMNSHLVVGVGNIYANEALFESGIRPDLQAGKLSRKRCENLSTSIKNILSKAILQGGTTLRDFVNSDGNPGYFQQLLNVYGREGKPCNVCNKSLKAMVLNQRSSFFCSSCQR